MFFPQMRVATKHADQALRVSITSFISLKRSYKKKALKPFIMDFLGLFLITYINKKVY